ncbi:hypothetical protein AVEN_151071-1 [Araneus ventricosus]|uniref:Uncharacterized protein n=1 Tax=Araneus ventricosus TaxID=182803 RepID=A0A4Y2TFI3_ARAVE|nr:hypothetical protein AVEN_161083-1 [Araneus ventricosus]GBN94345.1 hypothetical protein AVEN_51578-1 [Araneus ventricosus]GBN99260.1 hypothetical protein AVEN_253078-1 [Araneus ventricosus]GBN99287.1 hypothetical protein AVEN_151071-1 [Araneus ventricosus]
MLPLSYSRQFQDGTSPPRFPERTSLSLPPFVVFAFVRNASCPLTAIAFQFDGPVRRMDENPNISTTQRQFSSDFGATRSKWCGTERS